MLNRMAEQMVGEIGGTFIDITTMLSYRPDGHMESDCGHWCLPGAYDVAATLLHNAALGLTGGPLREVLRRPQRKAVGRGRGAAGRQRARPKGRGKAKGRGRGKGAAASG